MVKTPIYMDNHATTPVDPRVLEAMLPYFTEVFGNAASRNHVFGHEAEAAVEQMRGVIGAAVGAEPRNVIFTSGATESDNMAIKGVAEFYRERGNHVITQVTEHKAVLDTCKELERRGYEVTYLPVDRYGLIDLDDLRKAIKSETILISIMMANNEIGTIQPVKEIGAIAKEKGVLFHSDATQAVGKLPVDVDELGIDLLSMSAHKIYGPKGVGALYVRGKNPRVRLAPLFHGGGHERGMRSGTLNVSGIVGFGKALQIAVDEMESESARVKKLRDKLETTLRDRLDEVFVNGHPTLRLAGNLNMSFAYVEGESLLMGLREIALSSGSACTSATLEPSYVLKAIGVSDDLAHTSLRFGLGRFNTEEEVDYAADRVVEEVNRLREMSPLYEMAKSGVDLKTMAWKRD
ncbi:MAG TPA: IscS subfamily cysteine desulfurase [Candidatus Latescibacteria bacterium]|nr:IscS subfamily cysteine desulfurase [Candidatus Latescibacterota bacterium]